MEKRGKKKGFCDEGGGNMWKREKGFQNFVTHRVQEIPKIGIDDFLFFLVL